MADEKAGWQSAKIETAMFFAYFPVRVVLTRIELKRVIAMAWAATSGFEDSSLNTHKEACGDAQRIIRDLDSALKFDDEDFVLLTKKEFDELSARPKVDEAKAESVTKPADTPPKQTPADQPEV